jgi:hypothetical protein
MRAIALVVLGLVACKGGAPGPTDRPPITAPWSDDFERTNLGDDYYATSEVYQLMNGALGAKGAYNHPLWLRKPLPERAVIELDVWSNSPDGDIKVEFFGDGKSHAHNKGAYRATGYVACMGGWSNSKSFLARQDEHGKVGEDLVVRTQPKVELGKRYHWKIVRDGARVDWFVDDMNTPFLSYDDKKGPLSGPGNAYFGINNWQSDSWFDNLSISPMP